LNVLDFAHLGEESCPYRLDFLYLCGGDERLKLIGLPQLVFPLSCGRAFLYSDVDTVIGEDEGSV
jgi:hypothetical protein